MEELFELLERDNLYIFHTNHHIEIEKKRIHIVLKESNKNEFLKKKKNKKFFVKRPEFIFFIFKKMKNLNLRVILLYASVKHKRKENHEEWNLYHKWQTSQS